MNMEVKPRDVYRARNVWTTSISVSDVFLPHVVRSLLSGLNSTATNRCVLASERLYSVRK